MSITPEQASTEHDGAERVTATVAQLEQEGDIAADYLEGLLDIADIDGDLALDVRSGRAYVSVENDDAEALRVLSNPDTVQALQELTRIAVQTKTGRFSRLILDVGGSRDARQQQLEKLVDRAIARLDEGASQASLRRCPATSASSSTTSWPHADWLLSPTVRARIVTRSSVAPDAS